MQRSNKTLKPSPSIHNIIIEDQQIKLNNQIKQFFKTQSYPTFPLTELLSLPNCSSDQRFYLLVKQLQQWNRKVQANLVSNDSRAQLYRNKFIFTSLKNLILYSTKNGESYQTNLNKLYQWWRKNSTQQMPMFLTTRKKTKQDQQWQIRKTFKSNMPLELKNYQRRALFSSQQQMNYFQSKNKQNNQEKLINYMAVKQFNSKQLRLRQARQQEQIQYGKTLLKNKKSRFLQDNCHNIQLYKGSFNQCSKTSVLFERKTHKSALDQYSRVKNCNSLSLMDKEKDEIHNIKKYRFNSALTKKGNLFPQRDTNINKTSKTFLTTKPIDATISDFGANLMTTRKDFLLTKQLSIGVDELEGGKDGVLQRDEKQNKVGEFNDFMELGNWDGGRLMSNPFEKKKQLKKGKKK